MRVRGEITEAESGVVRVTSKKTKQMKQKREKDRGLVENWIKYV